MSYIKTIKSGLTLEIYEYEKKSPVAARRKRSPEASGSRRVLDTPKRRYDSVKRTRRNFKRLVLANTERFGAPAFLTLTMREVVTVEEGSKCFDSFFKTVRAVISPSVQYIGVLEFQRRGAIHYHILVWGIPSSIVLNERRVRCLQACWAQGFVDIISTDGSQKLATYLAKYMVKSSADSRLFGKRGYYISRGLDRPSVVSNTPIHNYVKEVLGVDNRLVFEREYDTLYNGRCFYRLIELIP